MKLTPILMALAILIPRMGVAPFNPKPDECVDGGNKIFYAYDFTEDEEWELLHIGQAESGNQGVYGICLTMRCVLNRVEDEAGRFGNSIHEVVTAPNQFSTVSSGAWYAEPNEDCYEALELIRQGWDESQGALYFRATWSGHFSWANYLFTYGGHNFYN